jgi:hypothetical protein
MEESSISQLHMELLIGVLENDAVDQSHWTRNEAVLVSDLDETNVARSTLEHEHDGTIDQAQQ